MKNFILFCSGLLIYTTTLAEPVSDCVPYHLLYEKNPIYNLEQKPLLSILKNDLKQSMLYGNLPDFEQFKINKTKQYYPNGNVMIDFQQNANDAGIQIIYYENGNIMAQIPFSENMRNGIQKLYYQNGILAGILPYQNDMINGELTTYHINGNIQMRQTYQNNVKINNGKMYHANGNLYLAQNSQNGQIHGMQTLYYPDGVIQAQIPYQNGIIDGIVQLYYPSGQTLATLTFQNGNITQNICYTSFGQQSSLNRAEIYKLQNGMFPIQCYYQQE